MVDTDQTTADILFGQNADAIFRNVRHRNDCWQLTKQLLMLFFLFVILVQYSPPPGRDPADPVKLFATSRFWRHFQWNARSRIPPNTSVFAEWGEHKYEDTTAAGPDDLHSQNCCWIALGHLRLPQLIWVDLESLLFLEPSRDIRIWTWWSSSFFFIEVYKWWSLGSNTDRWFWPHIDIESDITQSESHKYLWQN